MGVELGTPGLRDTDRDADRPDQSDLLHDPTLSGVCLAMS